MDEQFPLIFDRQATFHAIMATELAAKCMVIFAEYERYESLDGAETLRAIQAIAKGQGHALDRLLERIAESQEELPIRNILASDLVVPGTDGLRMSVKDFIGDVVKPAYIETRYPVSIDLATQFDGYLPHLDHNIPNVARDLLRSCVFLFKTSEESFSLIWSSLKRFTHGDLRVRFLRYTLGWEVEQLDELIALDDGRTTNR
jgi:hypothetical protein